MKIVADSNVPFLEGVFEPYAEVVYIEGRAINHDDVKDADALIIRTRTKCNADLLDGTSVKMIATATIGTDHIDLEYCRDHGIEVHNAEGCNAGGVMQYVWRRWRITSDLMYCFVIRHVRRLKVLKDSAHWNIFLPTLRL